MSENTPTQVDVRPPGSGEPPEELPPSTAEQDAVREQVPQARKQACRCPATAGQFGTSEVSSKPIGLSPTGRALRVCEPPKHAERGMP